jgi:hypothetical protein
MQIRHVARRHSALVGLLILASVSACSDRDDSGGGSANTIVTAPAVSVAAVVGGGSQTVSLGFNSSDTQQITNLSVTSGLSPMPAGWSGPSTFSCAAVSTGSGCLLNLIYKPAAVGAGTLTIAYSFTDNGGAAQKATATINYASTTNNNAVATAAPAGQITAMVGHGAQTVAVTFTTDDGNPATALTLTTDLATLPSGWASTAKNFACASLSTGNGCQLPLTYTPPAVASGTLTLSYSYNDNSGDGKTGTLALTYVGTNSDNVVGTVAPSGQVVSVLGSGNQAVTVTFTTDDGNAATSMSLTSALSTLPSGWSSSASGLTCATLSTGNGCQLPLSFAPMTVGSGTLALTYSYTDVGGHAKTGTVNIPYAGTIHDNVVGTATPSGQVAVLANSGTQAVQVTFDTDDGNLASGFSVTSNLNSLPSGWTSSAHSFACVQVSSGSTCQLSLTYIPDAVGSGTLAIQYAYTDNAGTAKTGAVSIPYVATVHDNVVGVATPTGQVVGAIGDAGHPVSVTFTTDDGNPATALSVTSATLSALPLGWTATAGSLTCATVSAGSGCQLGLIFTPVAAATGTLSVSYAYVDNAGTAKNGTVNIAYVSTSHNTASGAQTPGGTIRVRVGASKQTQVIFTTNDGNTATNLSITSDLSTLPAGWSGTNGFTCSAVNSGGACSLALTYAPVANATGTITLDFSYTDSAFTAKTGTATLSYSNPHLYVLGNTTNLCSLIADGGLGTCVATATSANTVNAFGPGAFSGAHAYLPGANSDLYICSFESDGTLDSCTEASFESSEVVYAIATFGDYVYLNYYDDIQVCTLGAAGSLDNCAVTAASSTSASAYGIAVDGNYAYIVNYSVMSMCLVSPTDGTLNNCSPVANSALSGAGQIKIYGGYVYAIVGAGVTSCAIAADGSLPNCSAPVVGGATDIAMVDADAYVPTSNAVYHCTVDQSTGLLSACVISNGNLGNQGSYGVMAQ